MASRHRRATAAYKSRSGRSAMNRSAIACCTSAAVPSATRGAALRSNGKLDWTTIDLSRTVPILVPILRSTTARKGANPAIPYKSLRLLPNRLECRSKETICNRYFPTRLQPFPHRRISDRGLCIQLPADARGRSPGSFVHGRPRICSRLERHSPSFQTGRYSPYHQRLFLA